MVVLLTQAEERWCANGTDVLQWKHDEKEGNVDWPKSLHGMTSGDQKDAKPNRVENRNDIESNTDDSHRGDVTDLSNELIRSGIERVFLLLPRDQIDRR